MNILKSLVIWEKSQKNSGKLNKVSFEEVSPGELDKSKATNEAAVSEVCTFATLLYIYHLVLCITKIRSYSYFVS